MRSEEEVVQEFGSWHDYLELQRPAVDSQDGNAL